MSFTPFFKPSFFKDIKKIPKLSRDRMTQLIELIIKDPFLINAKKLAGHTHLYRYRIGDYRLVYYVQQHLKRITFLLVAHRKEVYRLLKKLPKND